MADQQTYLFSDKTRNTNAQCKVIIYPWSYQLDDTELPDDKLSQTSRLDISSQIVSCTVSKSMANPAGSFSITLANSSGYGTGDWKDIIKRGFWCLIYMSQDGDLTMNPRVGPPLNKNTRAEAKRLRCIGYVKRVAAKLTKQSNKSLAVEFEVSGKDFGVVYEETSIWHNLFKYESILIDSIKTSQLNVTGNISLKKAMDLIHDLFYFPANIPGAKVDDNNSLLSIGLQWLLPRQMLQDVGFNLSGLTKGTYWGALPNVKDFHDTLANIAVSNPTDFLSGNAWEQLRKLSIPPYHELFTELRDDGTPKLVFRPIPWGIDQSNYPTAAQYIKLYRNLSPVVNVPAIDLMNTDVGEDDDNRYNSFLATVSTSLINTEDNISLLLGTDYPQNNRASVRRHGFRPMHVTVDSIVKNTELANGTADQRNLIEFNEILYDYWNNGVFAESGSIEKIGSNDVKCGKVMKFNKDVPYLTGKRYYIEGYVDTYRVGEKRESSWTQDVSLTRGFEEADLAAKVGFSKRNTPFTSQDEFTPSGNGTDKL